VNVLIISPTTDFAGVGINLKRAFDEFSPTWHARHVVRTPSPYSYPMDFWWPRRDRAITEQVRTMFRKADIVHVMDKPNVLTHFHRERQRFVVQHLGTRYRENPEQMTAQSRMYDAIEITDSIDLLLYPHVRFVPVAVDTRALLETRRQFYRPGIATRIAHAPTDRSTSDTDVVLAVIERLRQEIPIEFDLIENVSNQECIERKARADIYIDRMGIGFGVNAIECWSMGIPVVSGFGNPAFTERAMVEFGVLPWYEATRESLYHAVRTLCVDAERRGEYRLRGLDHANRFHSFEAVLSKVTAIYDEALQAVAA
jgi:hypothetical protein